LPADKSELADLRREIDAIDDALHDLLMRRVTLTGRVAASKPSSGVPLRPAREAEILRRLVARHSGPFPKAVVARIWREIISANTALQASFAIAVLASRASDAAVDDALVGVAREHYGALTPIQSFETASSVLRAVSDGRATAALLPLPTVEATEPWWRLIARDVTPGGGAVPRIVARLPFAPGATPAQEGLVVSLAPHQPSGSDRSYLVIETDGEVSRSTLKKRLATAGLEALDMQSAGGQQLVEVAGFVAPDSDALAAVAGAEGIARALAIGGYAIPFTAAELGGGKR
jgi:chorismate mutase/prephenate dehydratase